MDLLRFLSPSLHAGSALLDGWATWVGAGGYVDVPRAQPSLRVTAEAFLDQLFFLGTSTVVGVPRPAELRQAADDVRAAHEFLTLRGYLDDPAEYHRAPAAPDEWTLEPATTWLGVRPLRYQYLRFPSAWAPHDAEPGSFSWQTYDSNRDVHAYVLEHPGAPRPWLVCVHAFAMGSPAANMYGFDARWLHETLGLNVIMPALPLHGPRAPGLVSGREILNVDLLRIVHLLSHAVWDVRRTIAWVRSRGATQIGLYGLSLGGCTSALVASLETGLDAVIAGIPVVDFATVARDNQPLVVNRYDAELQNDWPLVRKVSQVICPLALTPKVPHDRRFIFAGIADRVVRPDQARALWRHWDHPEIHWFEGGHVGFQWNPSIPRFVGEALRRTGFA